MTLGHCHNCQYPIKDDTVFRYDVLDDRFVVKCPNCGDIFYDLLCDSIDIPETGEVKAIHFFEQAMMNVARALN